jgi:transcriptional regulator with XRE-family HTH domain
MAESFGLVLRKLRQDKSLSQVALAERMNYDQSLISKIERGQRAPSEDFVRAFCQVLQLSDLEQLYVYTTARAGAEVSFERHERWSPQVRFVAFECFVSGTLFFVFFGLFALVRTLVVEGGIDIGGILREGTANGGVVALIAVALAVAAIPVGFLFDTVYEAVYDALGIRSRDASIDRAYPVLESLGRKYSIDFMRQFGAGVQPPSGDGYRIGPYRVARRDMVAATENWQLLRQLWNDAVARGNLYEGDHIVGEMEERFRVYGSLICSVMAAFVFYIAFYMIHDLIVIWKDWSYVASIVANVVLLCGVLYSLHTVRGFIGIEAMATRRFFLDQTYSILGSPASLGVGGENRRGPQFGDESAGP